MITREKGSGVSALVATYTLRLHMDVQHTSNHQTEVTIPPHFPFFFCSLYYHFPLHDLLSTRVNNRKKNRCIHAETHIYTKNHVSTSKQTKIYREREKYGIYIYTGKEQQTLQL